jgi:pectate lyase
MRPRFVAVTALCGLVLLTSGGTSVAATDLPEGVARQALGFNDGWGSFSTGTNGGAEADAAHVFVAHDRGELVAALGGDNATNGANAVPKIVFVAGTIDGNVDDANQPLTCDAYRDPAFTLDAYLAQFDPAVWGKMPITGPLEDARKRSEKNQAARVQVRVGPNTTLIGLGGDARLLGVNLFVQNVDNVIVRNIAFENAFDCFPQWDPNDGATGNWNSTFDNISLRGATHVWIDRNSFSDGAHPDSLNPTFFGREFQIHDGECDITNGSDLVTVSWNRFQEHDKTMLIGGTDSPTQDLNKLRVTLHHNLFEDLGQRAPRVRFGQVHVFNNLYVIPDTTTYVYSWGVGVQSRTFAQSNFFETPSGVAPDQLIRVFGGTAIHTSATIVNGLFVDPLAAYNATHTPALSADVGWRPTLFTQVDPARLVPDLVRGGAGVGHLS